MKKLLLFLSSFVIVLGAAASVWFAFLASGFQRDLFRGMMGRPQSQFQVGYAYEHGLGVGKDPARARLWYGKASARGLDAATVHLALLMLRGEGGDKDEKTACRLFRETAERGNVKARMNAARCDFLGIDKDKSEADGAAWVKKAAESGASEATALMGILYLGGIGVPQDHDIAIKWLRKSEEPAAKELAAKLSAQNDILDALPRETRAEKWKGVYADMEAGVRAAFDRILEREAAQEEEKR
jgi:TPR repeat protein